MKEKSKSKSFPNAGEKIETYPFLWKDLFESNLASLPILIVIRMFLSCYMTIILVWTIMVNPNIDILRYLTNWALFSACVYTFLITFVIIRGLLYHCMQKSTNNFLIEKFQISYCLCVIIVAFQQIGVVLQWAVLIAYWTLLDGIFTVWDFHVHGMFFLLQFLLLLC